VMLPMYQAEALWLNFDGKYIESRETQYPYAIKVAAGKINAVTGEQWSPELSDSPQDYLVSPGQPWLDGYCVEKGFIRQFVAMPLGSGYSAEEQLTGEAEHGGLQIVAYPMKREVFDRRFPKIKRRSRMAFSTELVSEDDLMDAVCCVRRVHATEMGLAAGGRMHQELYEDPYGLDDWDQTAPSRCFVHLCNSLVWEQITGKKPPTTPLTARQYERYGLPWFDYYDEKATTPPGSDRLKEVRSVAELVERKRDVPLPENESVSPGHVVPLGPKASKDQVREEVI